MSAAATVRYTADQQARIRQLLPGSWYRMHPHAQAAEWRAAARELGLPVPS